jgi:hypothetical protein
LGVALLALVLLRAWRLPDWARNCRTFTRQEIGSILARGGVAFEMIGEVKRSADGNSLLVHGGRRGQPTCAQIELRSLSVRAWPAPSWQAFTGEDGRFVAWIELRNDLIRFASGDSVHVPSGAPFDVDPDGRYYVIGENRRAWIGRIGSSTQSQLMAEDLLATRVFARGNRVFLCGIHYGGAGGETPNGRCLVLEDDGSTFRVIETHDLPRRTYFIDKDPVGDHFIAVKSPDHSAWRFYGYDLATRRLFRVSSGREYGVFVSGQVR